MWGGSVSKYDQTLTPVHQGHGPLNCLSVVPPRFWRSVNKCNAPHTHLCNSDMAHWNCSSVAPPSASGERRAYASDTSQEYSCRAACRKEGGLRVRDTCRAWGGGGNHVIGV